MTIYDVEGDGDDDALYEELGGEAPAVRQGNRPGVQRVDASKLPIGFGGAGLFTVPASSSVTAEIRPNMLFRPDILILDEAIAPSVTVADVKVGAISLNASAGAASGDAFRHNTVSKLRGAVSGSPSVAINVTINNRTAGALTNAALCIKGPVMRVA